MKKIDKSIRIINLDLSIHKTWIKFINSGIFNNNQIFDFIQNDEYYTEQIYSNSKERDLKILEKIKFKEIDKKILEKWNNI